MGWQSLGLRNARRGPDDETDPMTDRRRAPTLLAEVVAHSTASAARRASEAGQLKLLLFRRLLRFVLLLDRLVGYSPRPRT